MDALSESTDCSAFLVAEAVNDHFNELILEKSKTDVPVLLSQTTDNHTVSWKSKSHGTICVSMSATEVCKTSVSLQTGSSRATLLKDFMVDSSTYCHAHIRATLYPKFENEKTDQEIRKRMIELVSK